MLRQLTAYIFITIFVLPLTAQKTPPPFLSGGEKWVDSVFQSLSPDQRIGQLFMVAAWSNENKNSKELKELIKKYNIGGIIWMQGGPVRQAKLAGYYQSLAKTPLLYSMDAEWGMAMRLDSVPRYPKHMTLGAITNDSLIYEVGRQMARDFKRMGMHISFSPDADINNNAGNPVIGMRSFGENKYNVARKASMLMNGLQDEHVLANGKHFPGHGDTEADSHFDLPKMPHSKARLDSLELYPFRYIFDRGLGSVMVAHLNVPAIDTTRNVPSTLSPKFVNGLLKTELGFKGLIFTDAMNMQGVAKYYPPGVADVRALMAGNDVILFPGNVPKAVAEINKAIKSGQLSQVEIEARCKKILMVKYWCGLTTTPEIVSRNLYKDLNNSNVAQLNTKLAENAITLLSNANNFLPLKHLDTLKVLSIAFGDTAENALVKELRNFGYIEHAGLSHTTTASQLKRLAEKIRTADVLIISINRSNIKPPNNFGTGKRTLQIIDSLAHVKPTVLALFTNAYLLNSLSNPSAYKAILMGYESMPELQIAAAKVIAGDISAPGKLPVSVNAFPYGSGIDGTGPVEKPNDKMAFQEKKFARIDSIALWGIREKAYPGCQIVAIKNGKVIYQKSFGKYTYNKDAETVSNATMYDLASLTKIMSSAMILMKLQSDKQFDYHNTLGFYLNDLKGTNKDTLPLENILTHRAGLTPFLAFNLKTLHRNGTFKQGIFSEQPSDLYSITVARHLYMAKSYRDTMFKQLNTSKLEKYGQYAYSDLGYYYTQRIAESITGKPLDVLAHDLYAKLGVGLRYTPLQYFSRIQIAPTEIDVKFRKQLIQGYVHDPGAAMMGGVAGHAGVFGTASDVAKIMQLYLNKGELNGVRLLDSNVVKDYTSYHFEGNRRGLCFDKPEPDAKKDSPVSAWCSPQSFGHTGFTGTFAWADPANGLIVVILTNRVYPNADENKLTKLSIRTRIHKTFYEILQGEK